MEKLLIHRVYSIYRSALIGGAESLSHCFTRDCKLLQCELEKANRTTKSRDEVLGPPKRLISSFLHFLQLIIYSNIFALTIQCVCVNLSVVSKQTNLLLVDLLSLNKNKLKNGLGW